MLWRTSLRAVLWTAILVVPLGCGATSLRSEEPVVTPLAGSGPSSRLPMGGQDDLKRFVEMALQAQMEAASSSEEGEWASGRAWYDAFRERIDFPRSLCAWDLYPSETPGLPMDALPAVNAECEGSRCVAWLQQAGQRQALHLLFDEEGHLTATALGDEASNERATLPPAPDGLVPRLCGVFDALLSNRFGEEVFVITGGGGEEDRPSVARLCGEAAAERVELIGDDFECNETGCVQLEMCGNSCVRVAAEVRDGEFEVGAIVDAALGGDGPPRIDAAHYAAWRGEVECGDSLELSADFVETL